MDKYSIQNLHMHLHIHLHMPMPMHMSMPMHRHMPMAIFRGIYSSQIFFPEKYLIFLYNFLKKISQFFHFFT